MALDRLSQTYETANASVAAGFDPTVHTLVLDQVDGANWLLDRYARLVLYKTSGSKTYALTAMRLIEEPLCRSVEKSQTLASASVHVSWGCRKGFCTLSMPRRPTLPEMRISVKTDHRFEVFLPVTRGDHHRAS
jgi:hypothetical protein